MTSDEIEQAPTEVIATGFQGPHTMLLRPGGALWVGEHFAGPAVALTIDQP